MKLINKYSLKYCNNMTIKSINKFSKKINCNNHQILELKRLVNRSQMNSFFHIMKMKIYLY